MLSAETRRIQAEVELLQPRGYDRTYTFSRNVIESQINELSQCIMEGGELHPARAGPLMARPVLSGPAGSRGEWEPG